MLVFFKFIFFGIDKGECRCRVRLQPRNAQCDEGRQRGGLPLVHNEQPREPCIHWRRHVIHTRQGRRPLFHLFNSHPLWLWDEARRACRWQERLSSIFFRFNLHWADSPVMQEKPGSIDQRIRGFPGWGRELPKHIKRLHRGPLQKYNRDSMTVFW